MLATERPTDGAAERQAIVRDTEQLQALVTAMQVPVWRRRDPGWKIHLRERRVKRAHASPAQERATIFIRCRDRS